MRFNNKCFILQKYIHNIPDAGNIIAAYSKTTYKALNKVMNKKNAYIGRLATNFESNPKPTNQSKTKVNKRSSREEQNNKQRIRTR